MPIFKTNKWAGGEMLERVDVDKVKVKSDYMSGMKTKEIAEKYEISLNTLKSWIKRYKWSEEKKKGAPLNNKNSVGNSDGGSP